MREGNILDLPTQQLSVVEACSGIRSLLSLTFLSLVYGYFFEKRIWLRVVLFLATIPVALTANAGRVMVTGILSQIRSDLAEGFFHESTGMVIFLAAGVILFSFIGLFFSSSGLAKGEGGRGYDQESVRARGNRGPAAGGAGVLRLRVARGDRANGRAAAAVSLRDRRLA